MTLQVAQAAKAEDEAAVAAARLSAHGDGAAMQMYEFQGNTLVASTHKFARVRSAPLCSKVARGLDTIPANRKWQHRGQQLQQCCPAARCNVAVAHVLAHTPAGAFSAALSARYTGTPPACSNVCVYIQLHRSLLHAQNSASDVAVSRLPYCTALQSVERNTLARQCPTLLTLLKAFPTKMELQEPTFKDIVVVYR
jgi:hypothetical protein